MITQPVSDFPLLENFVNGDDRYRNAGFKLIPHIAKVTHYGQVICVLNLTRLMSLVVMHAFWFGIYTCWGHLKNVNFFSFWTCGNCYAKIGFMWTGLLDCEAECGQDGLFDWGSFGYNLPYRKELYWGMSSRFMSTSWEPYKTNFTICSFQFDCLFFTKFY